MRSKVITRITLQCQGPKDCDWYNLNSDVYPPEWDDKERRTCNRRFDALHQGWSDVFRDHRFRVVMT